MEAENSECVEHFPSSNFSFVNNTVKTLKNTRGHCPNPFVIFKQDRGEKKRKLACDTITITGSSNFVYYDGFYFSSPWGLKSIEAKSNKGLWRTKEKGTAYYFIEKNLRLPAS